MQNHYKHSNPEKYDIQVKIATVRTSSHSKHNINYHIVWIPKYRKKLLTGKVKEVLKTIIQGQCEDMQLENLALEILPDHLHLFVGAKPTHIPFQIVKQLKGNTACQLRRCFPRLRFLNYPRPYRSYPNLWARGYYIGSAGHVSQDAVKRYIMEQEHKPSVFEYSIFGAPQESQATIGDFTC